MKKLMIAAAIVCAAAISQAASVSWKTGGSIQPDGKTNAAAKTLNLYVWTVSEQVFNDTALDSIWSTYGNTDLSKISGYATSKTAFSGSMGGTASLTVSAAAEGMTDTYYGIVITTYDSNLDGKADMYVVNKVTATMNDGGSAGGGANAAKYLDGVQSHGNITWQTAAVPEPTSALLMLMGLAGLALKRKRA